MSCGQIALRDMGVPIAKVYASEIDKHAIKQTQLNFPETIQLGDVEKWREWDIDWGSVDLLLAGSPCQGFSLAGKMLGHDDPRSKLYWVFLDILHHAQRHNPNVKFLLENVWMRPNDERQINESLGLMPVVINSSLVSAQNRVRLYWTNIRTRQEGLFGETYTDIPQPEDRGILIQDILENSVDEKYFLSPSVWSRHQTVVELAVGTWRTHKVDGGFREMVGDKSPCIPARARNDGSGQPCVRTDRVLRRLTPTECARLQTIPEWYKWQCSDTQAYKMLGNGWTVEVIKHILSFL